MYIVGKMDRYCDSAVCFSYQYYIDSIRFRPQIIYSLIRMYYVKTKAICNRA